MEIIIKIPKEFEEEFNRDKFEDSLARVASDIESFGFQLAGRYEQETIKMLREVLKDIVIIPKSHGRLIDADVFEKNKKREEIIEMLKMLKMLKKAARYNDYNTLIEDVRLSSFFYVIDKAIEFLKLESEEK